MQKGWGGGGVNISTVIPPSTAGSLGISVMHLLLHSLSPSGPKASLKLVDHNVDLLLINKPPPFKGLKIRIPVIIPINGRGGH